jgi:hypothetical protein
MGEELRPARVLQLLKIILNISKIPPLSRLWKLHLQRVLADETSALLWIHQSAHL